MLFDINFFGVGTSVFLKYIPYCLIPSHPHKISSSVIGLLDRIAGVVSVGCVGRGRGDFKCLDENSRVIFGLRGISIKTQKCPKTSFTGHNVSYLFVFV